jgi:predicted transcriptional regulator
MTVLLSIKPEFAEKIFDGTKKYEFRKAIFKRTDVRRILVYASSPVQKVIGEFQIEGILNDDVDKIWEETHLQSGISRDFYEMYFGNRVKAYAIKVGEVIRYQNAKDLSEYDLLVPPQSFAYLK